jgi:hypothetical protein
MCPSNKDNYDKLFVQGTGYEYDENVFVAWVLPQGLVTIQVNILSMLPRPYSFKKIS